MAMAVVVRLVSLERMPETMKMKKLAEVVVWGRQPLVLSVEKSSARRLLSSTLKVDLRLGTNAFRKDMGTI